MFDKIYQAIGAPHFAGIFGQAFLLLLNLIINEKVNLGPTDIYPPDFGPQLTQTKLPTFDFIIVGGGTAGCVLANRLSANPAWNVLLLEAGDYPSFTSEVPAFFPYLQNSEEDWNFIAETESKACLGLKDEKCRIPKGRVIGGTSTINNMHYARGNVQDFLNWAKELGDDWGPDCVFPNYDSLNIPLEHFESDHPIKEIIYEAGKNFSYNPMQPGDVLGYTENAAYVSRGIRQNIAKIFLVPIKARTNFFMATKAYVTKILIPKSPDKKARAVELVLNDKQIINVTARREVILSAGAINTPKILMVSGIGPAEHLKKMKVEILADLIVGQNLQEHYAASLFVGFDDGVQETPNREMEFIDDAYYYLVHKKRSFINTNINDLVASINSQMNPFDMPNIQIYHYFFKRKDMHLGAVLDSIGFHPAIVKNLTNYNQNRSIIAFFPTVLKPKSRGRVMLNHTNPRAPPLVFPNFFSDDEDFDVMLAAYKYVVKLLQSPAFKEQDVELLNIDIPNCRNLKFCTEHYVKCSIKNLGFALGHAVGTAKMGVCCATSVVDDRLLVRGIRGLRIVDASVMPEIVSGDIQATAAMIAERASRFIAEKWKDPRQCGG